MNNNAEMLNQVKKTIDERMTELWNISLQIADNPSLSSYRRTDNLVDARKSVTALKNYIFTDNFIREIVLYLKDKEQLLSSAGTYTPESFINSIYHYENWNITEFENELNSISFPRIRPAENITLMNKKQKRFVTYLIPIPYDSVKQYGTILFLINEDSFHNILNDLLKTDNSSVFIMNKDYKIITTLNKKKYIKPDVLKNYIDISKKTYTSRVNINKKNFFLSSIYSASTGWTYITATPVKEVISPLIYIQKRSLYGIIIILILGSIIIFFLMRVNYQPIKRLKLFAEENLGKNLSGINELKLVEVAVEQMSKRTRMLNTKIKNSRSAIKESLLMQLVQGHIHDINEFNQKGKEINLKFNNPYYFVVIILLNKHEKFNKSIIIDTIEQNLPEGLEGYGKDIIEQNFITFIFATDKKGHSDLENDLQQLHLTLQAELNLKTTIGIGNPCQVTTELGKSYLEASKAIDYRLIKGNNQLIFFDEITTTYNNTTGYYPHQELEQLELSLLQGDADKINKIIKTIVEQMKENSIPLFIARSVCFDIINTITKTINRVNQESKLHKSINFDILSLAQFETVEELARRVQEKCLEFCNNMQLQKKHHNKTQVDQFITYINNNYDDYNFSVQGMADYFQLSLSNLSHYFKDQTGETISVYVSRLRMEKSKKLLTTTDENIENIASQVGYTNSSSFIRKFKQVTGTTPGAYRDIYN